MKKPNPSAPGQKRAKSRLLATTAVSVSLLASAQEPLRAQEQQQVPVIDPLNQAPDPEAALEKYFAVGYNYCDAKVLAAFWGEATPFDAKHRLGQKMLDFGPEDGALHIRNARREAMKKPVPDMPVWFTDGGYTFDDAEVLGEYWGNGILGAKYKMTKLLVEGRDDVIQASLGAARR